MLSSEELEQIKQFRQQGWSIRRIARELKRDAKTVAKYVGGNRKAEMHFSDNAQKVFGKLNSGIRPEQIVEQEGLPPDTVIEMFNKWQAMKGLNAEAWRASVCKWLRL